MNEHDISFRSGDETLVGTLTQPDGAGPFPGCLLLNGSGPLDRDSNVPGQRLDIARSLAAALAEVGIATLRYDKRGVGASSGEYLTTSFDEELADACAALDALRDGDVTNGRVAVIGHSVGATVAVRLVDHHRPPDAYALLAGAAQNGERVMAWQTQRIARTRRMPFAWLRSRVERRQAADRELLLASTSPTAVIRGQTLPAQWFREYMAYDPADDLGRIDQPVLAVTGGKDVQVDVHDVARIEQLVVGPFDGDTPTDLTHLLRSDAGPPGLRSYGEQMQRPPDPALIERVATWVAAQLSRA